MSDAYQRPPVKVALMGLGRSMLTEHICFYREHPNLFKVVCACDTSKERRDLVEKTFPECRMFRRYDEMLDERDIELVDIASCTNDHVKHAMASLKRGYWTLLETPMALTFDEAQVLRGQVLKANNRLIVLQRGLSDPDYLLAKQMMTDPRLGRIYGVRVRKEDFVRRDDWQAVNRLGGGASYYVMTDMLLQTLKMLPSPPVQMWSELKRIASLGDAEDYAHVIFKTREQITADIEFNGGVLSQNRGPSFVIRGDRGEFSVMPGASEGRLVVVNPDYKFPRRRSSVRQPPLEDLHEEFPVLETTVSLLADLPTGPEVFWRQLYLTVRTAAPFPITADDSMMAIKFVHLMKKTSTFGKGHF